MVLTDDFIKQLYTDPDFEGSFSGIQRMRHFIEQKYQECISLNRLARIMNSLPEYMYQLKPIRKYNLRSYQVDGFGQLLECDLGFMPNYLNFRYFLLMIDCFSEKIFAIALRKKNATVVGRALQIIIDQINSPISCIQSDQGNYTFCRAGGRGLKGKYNRTPNIF